MKIFKILFLGIVLVLFNLAYLTAQTLPDTIRVKSSGAEPGGVLKLTYEVRIHTVATGGFLLVVEGLPKGLLSTETGVDLTEGGTAPTDPGTWWYVWTADYGKIAKANATDASAILTLGDESDLLSVDILGFNVDLFATLGPPMGIPDKSGDVLDVFINVPADMVEDSYTLTLPSDGQLIAKFPVAEGTFVELPVVEIDQIIIAEIPDDNTLRLDASLTALSGGTLTLPVYIANKDTVDSGSFKLTYPSSALTFSSVTAGTRAGGMTFSSGVALAGTALSAVGDKVASISFTAGEIPTGGLGDMCTVAFSVASLGAGATGSVVLSDVVLIDKVGDSLLVAASPQDTTELSFAFADTLAIAVQTGTADKGVPWEGTGIAPIIDGQLHLPIRLKNSVPVQSLIFYVTEGPVDKTGVLSADTLVPVTTLTPTSGWVATAVDSGSFVKVVAYAATPADGIPAGDNVVLHVVYDITLAEGEIPGVDDLGIDISFALAGVEVVDNTGSLVGIEKVGATATIDWRVPTSGEGVGPGAALPKAFALAQNHPNPFNPSTTINYQIPEDAGNVSFSLNVYDIRGRLVKTLAKGMKGSGFYSAFWDGSDSNGRQVSSGVYFYRFTSSKYSATRKMILLK